MSRLNALLRLWVTRAAWSLAALAVFFAGSEVRADSFGITNLVTNDQTAHPAQITDAHLTNAWGISHSGTSPFWVSANGSGLSVLYRVDPVTNATVKVGLEVTIPGDGSVTGQVFSGTAGAFNSDTFLFVSEDGTISGWRGALGTNAETLQIASAANVYKGAALISTGGHSYLLAANFKSGAIDVLKGDVGAPSLTGNFTDPGLPAGYAPFNVQTLGGKVYVAYALQGAGNDEQAGAGLGIVDVYDTQGNFLARVANNGGTLNAPWGLAIAPTSFGAFGGDLLVGNFGDGRINAYNLSTNTFVGQLTDLNNAPLEIDGLWALSTGNDGMGGSSQKIYFSAGPDAEANGLFGVIASVPEPSTLVMSSIVLGLFGAAGVRKRMKGNSAV